MTPSTVVSGTVADDGEGDQSFWRQSGAPKIKETIKIQSQDELQHSLSPADGGLLASVFPRGWGQTRMLFRKIMSLRSV